MLRTPLSISDHLVNLNKIERLHQYEEMEIDICICDGFSKKLGFNESTK